MRSGTSRTGISTEAMIPGVCAYITGGLTERLLGYPSRARANMSEALVLARQIAHPFSH